MELILFYIFGGLAVATALGVVFFKNPISSAVALVGALFAMAALYAMLDAHFLAIIQILVYAGAIMVLFIFVIMLLNLRGDELNEKPLSRGFKAVAILSLLGFLGLLLPLYQLFSIPSRSVGPAYGTVKIVGELLFKQYLFPFEYVSVLLLVSLIGGVVLAKREL